jgi:hypothetical protein
MAADVAREGRHRSIRHRQSRRYATNVVRRTFVSMRLPHGYRELIKSKPAS